MGEPFHAEAVDLEAGWIRVTNRRHTLGTDGVVLEWAIEVDGLPVQEGDEALPSIAPGETELVQLPIELDKVTQVGERWLTVCLVGPGHMCRGERHARSLPGRSSRWGVRRAQGPAEHLSPRQKASFRRTLCPYDVPAATGCCGSNMGLRS